MEIAGRFALRLQAADEKTGLGRDPRKHAHYVSHCRLRYSGDHNGEGIAENLSLGGCLLNTNDVLEIDSHLVVQLLLDNETTIQIHIAVTRWGVTPKYGLDFLLLDEQGEPFCWSIEPIAARHSTRKNEREPFVMPATSESDKR